MSGSSGGGIQGLGIQGLPIVPEGGNMLTSYLIEEGVTWTSNVQPLMDCLIYCSDGILMSSQIQLAAASPYLKQILLEVGTSEENRIKTIILPFIQSIQMKQVLDLICGGSVVLKNRDIQELVEVSVILGCTGDMIKEALIQSILPDYHEEQTVLNSGVKVLVHQLEAERSLDNILDQMQHIQQERMTSMEKALDNEKSGQIEGRTIIQKSVKEEDSDSDDFIVSDNDFSDYEGNSGYQYKKMKKESFDIISFEEKLLELGESTASRGGASVDCGVCDKSLRVPQLPTIKARISHFKKNHFNNCKKRIQGGSSSSPGTRDPVKKIDEDDDDALLEVYNKHVLMKSKENTDAGQHLGRRRAEVPPIQTIKSFLEAVGDARIVNGGNQIKCGLCCNKLKVNPDRPIMGNIRYFERTHLVRCPVKLSISGKPTELISESFLPGRSSNDRVLKTINMFDNAKASIVSKLITEIDDSIIKRRPGRPRKDKENEEEGEEMEVEEGDEKAGEGEEKEGVRIGTQYISKRKQCLVASRICFKCKVVFDSGSEIEQHFETDHPNSENPFHCLACQDLFNNYEDLISHLETDHNYRDNYACSFCEKDGFTTQYKLNRHINEKHPEEETVFLCSMCTKGFSSFHALKAHQKLHDGWKPNMMLEPRQVMDAMMEAFTCKFCGECIMHGKQLDTHIRENHSLKEDEHAYECKLCPQQDNHQYKIFYYYEQHLRNHGIYIDNICRVCKVTDLNRAKFNEHFKTQHPSEQPYDCPWPTCDKVFKKRQLQTEHITQHRVKEGDITDDMVYTCTECGKLYYSKKKYESHVRQLHEGKGLNIPEWDKKRRSYPCKQCSNTFTSRSLLQGHMRKHENNPCFMCDHCGKSFYRKDRLAVHTRAVHLNQKNYECEICMKRFMDNYKLKRHMKTHISGRGAAVGVFAQPKHTQAQVSSMASDVIPGVDDHSVSTITALNTSGEITTSVHHATDSGGHPTVAIVQVPHSYQIGPNHTIIRRPDGSSEAVTIQQIVDNQAILHLNAPVTAKRSTGPEQIIKFETDENSPVDFTQSSEEQRYIYVENYIEKTD